MVYARLGSLVKIGLRSTPSTSAWTSLGGGDAEAGAPFSVTARIEINIMIDRNIANILSVRLRGRRAQHGPACA